jgi:hypothetical protein
MNRLIICASVAVLAAATSAWAGPGLGSTGYRSSSYGLPDHQLTEPQRERPAIVKTTSDDQRKPERPLYLRSKRGHR